MEDRLTPSGGYLLVADYDGNSVLRYDATTGAFVDEFVPHNSGGLNQPQGLVFGPRDHNLYVTSGEVYGQGNDKAVMRFDGATGSFVDNFTGSDHLSGPHAVVFGPDGNLYVADSSGTNDHVARFNGTTGAFIDEFVPPNTPGERGPFGLVFGPGHPGGGRYDLYVTSLLDHSVQRYDGATGAPLGQFVASGSGGLQHAVGLTFGPDGNLYVTSAGAFSGGVDTIMRFNGRTGAPMPSPGNSGAVFVAAGSGGLLNTWGGPLFGPDGNGDGRQDLYVASFEWSGNNKAKAKTASIKRYDGTTGAFIDTFVALNSGGLDQPNYMTFTETDPVTLAYRPRVSISSATSAEGNKGQTTLLIFTVTLSTASNLPVTMSFATVDGTATANDKDYLARSGTLTFNPGEITKTITVELIGDARKEADEVFYLDLFGLSDSAVFDRSRGIGTILNDD